MKKLKHKHRITIIFVVMAVFLVLEQGLFLHNIIHQEQPKVQENVLKYLELNQSNVLFWLDYFQIKEKEIVFKQSILETGYFTSSVCIMNNNLFGLMKSKTEYYKFSHWIESIVAYKHKIQCRQKEKEDYYQFLKRIKYSSDKQYINKLKQININNK